MLEFDVCTCGGGVSACVMCNVHFDERLQAKRIYIKRCALRLLRRMLLCGREAKQPKANTHQRVQETGYGQLLPGYTLLAHIRATADRGKCYTNDESRATPCR